ncbi:MAG: hypothetical protein IPJ77_09300 [Planctomycetes bacterium]|nr:hypothetical protein [Planctomycetota bacterium]
MGPLSNWALGTTTSAGVSAGNLNQIQIRAPQVANSLPTSWTVRKFGQATANHPNYSVAQLTANWGFPVPPTSVPIFGSTSTGGDVIPVVDNQGLVQMATTQWFVVTFGLKPGASGLSGSVIANRVAQFGSVSGEIFSYYPEGPTGLNQNLGNTVQVEATHTQLGLPQGGIVHNLDYGMGVISTDPQNTAGVLASVRDKFYFTLSRAWLAANGPISWSTVSGQSKQVTPSDICRMTWSAGAWSVPTIAYTKLDLFQGGPNENLMSADIEIDALSVYNAPATSQIAAQERVIFSLARDVPGEPENAVDQFLVFQRGHGSPPLAATSVNCPATTLLSPADPQPGPLSALAGLRGPEHGDPDDVESTCSFDPDGPEVPPLTTNAVAGLPLNGTFVGEGTLGLSIFRTSLPEDSFDSQSPLSTDFMNYQVTGVQTVPTGLTFVTFHVSAGPPSMTQPPPTFTYTGIAFLVPYSSAPSSLSIFHAAAPCDGNPLQILAEVTVLDFATGLPVTTQQSWVITAEF